MMRQKKMREEESYKLRLVCVLEKLESAILLVAVHAD